jgi:signal transduction histidine kinase
VIDDVPMQVVRKGCAGGAFLLGALVVAFRSSPPAASDLVLVLVALVPWAVQLVRRDFLPAWAYAAPVLLSQAGLLSVRFQAEDPAPLLLIALVTTVGLSAPPHRSLLVAAAGVLVLAVGQVLGRSDAVLPWAVGLALTWLATMSIQRLKQMMEELQAAQDELAQQATVDERRRVAREVHDVVAHTLAVTMLHLTGARLALLEGDKDEAAEGLAEAERLGRESLVGLRQTVGLLTQTEAAVAPPAPDLRQLPALVQQYVDAGVRVSLDLDPPAAVPADVGLAGYRVVQESLANAARHASGSAVRVAVGGDAEWLRLDVADDGGTAPGVASDRPGQGLRGMAERVQLLGGRLAAGDRDDGPGWRVRVELPLSAPALPTSRWAPLPLAR